MKEFNISFGSSSHIENEKEDTQYRNWFYAHSYSFLAWESKSKIIRLSYKKQPNIIKYTFYKIVGQNRENIKLYQCNCERYRKYLAGKSILRCWKRSQVN